jgi:hypothetical protein
MINYCEFNEEFALNSLAAIATLPRDEKSFVSSPRNFRLVGEDEDEDSFDSRTKTTGGAVA